MSDVKLIRLVSGEEIVGTVTYDPNELLEYSIKDALCLVSGGEGRIGFIPFMAYCDDKEVRISEKHVLFTANPLDEVKEQVASFYSKIEVPSQQILTG